MKAASIKVILIDDDMVSLTVLENFCRKSGLVEVQGKFNDPTLALEFLKANIIDVVFLDVEMPGLSGFELLDRLTYLPKIVLTTSKTDYAFTAFQYEVADYLKKPITYDRFIRSMGKIAESIAAPPAPATVEKEDIPASANTQKDVFIRSDGKLVRMAMDDILYVECIGDYVKYVSADKKIV